MEKSVKEALEILRSDASALEPILHEALASHGMPWAFDLVLQLEERESANKRGARPSEPALWIRALLAASSPLSILKAHQPIQAIEDGLRFGGLAQAVARWLGFTQGRPVNELFEEWLGDASKRSSVLGPLLLPFLRDPSARELCLDGISERCEEAGTVALSSRWFAEHGDRMAAEVAAQLGQAKAKTASMWSRVLANARSTAATDQLVAFALSADKRAHQIARDVLLEDRERTLAALERGTWTQRTQLALSRVLLDACRSSGPAPSAREARDAEKQRIAQEKERILRESREAAEAARQQLADQQAARRAVFAAQDKERVDALVATHRSWLGRLQLSYADLADAYFDLGKLLRCGWHKRDSEESHTFLYYLVRRIGDAEAEIRLRDDVYWDELPRAGVRVQSLRLPEPFGSRSPTMDRMLGEFFSARIDPATTSRRRR